MNKAELIEAIAQGSNLTKADAGRALDAFLDSMNKTLKKGERIGIMGFGSFTVADRKARVVRNPKTQVEISIAAKRVVKFRPGNELCDAVNKKGPKK